MTVFFNFLVFASVIYLGLSRKNYKLSREFVYRICTVTVVFIMCYIRQHFFSERVINTWNKLDSDIVCSSSLNMFKNHLERLHKDESFIGLFRSAWLRRPSQSPGEASSGKLSGKLFRLYNFLIRANQCSAFNCESVHSLLNSSTTARQMLTHPRKSRSE